MDDGNEVVTFKTVTGLVQQLEASNYHDDLLNFVQQNNLDLMCYTSLIECGYTFEKLKYIDKDDINVIFPNREQTALRSEFRVKLFEWKASQGFSTSINDSQSSTLSWPQQRLHFHSQNQAVPQLIVTLRAQKKYCSRLKLAKK
ncbi:uncharacterized protein LOC118734149 isoform X3 [Rhagoletis pomonella]|uniref:uncharacterized protein LOC118734149 isoform X3 n=1 Tax=Rhagoletis pomonella TaxID=28610 RepID=UPI00177D5190|nr:uncharacterized protein LOC118734149 isoform X3 [Rhagoletis pomonella]